MKKILIDCGFHKGKISLDFYKKNTDCFIYAFEPNVLMNEYNLENRKIIGKNLFYYNNAVSDKEEKLNFNIGIKDMQGSSLLSGKKHLSDKIIQVDCIDLSKFILSNFTKDDYIILKMDIEGYEYIVLPHLIKEKSIYMINEFIIEFHSHKFLDNRFSETHLYLKDFFNKNKFYKNSYFWHI